MRGVTKSEQFEYPEQEWFYYLCAKEFGWTITETDEQPANLVTWLLEISNVVKEIENDSHKS